MVSPSELEMLSVRSSEPSARRLASLHAPHVIALECFPITGILLDVLWLYSIRLPLYDPIARVGPDLAHTRTFSGSRIPEIKITFVRNNKEMIYRIIEK